MLFHTSQGGARPMQHLHPQLLGSLHADVHAGCSKKVFKVGASSCQPQPEPCEIKQDFARPMQHSDLICWAACMPMRLLKTLFPGPSLSDFICNMQA